MIARDERARKKSHDSFSWPSSMSWTTRVALARLLWAAGYEVHTHSSAVFISFSSGENGMRRTGPHVPGLSAPELLWLSSERIASSSTAPTTGLRR
jgi:hypothetical protein